MELNAGRCSRGRNNCSPSILLEEELAGEEDEQDLDGICDGAEEDSVGEAFGCG